MEDTPHVYISEFGHNEDMEEGEDEDVYQEEVNMEPDMTKSLYPDQKHPNQDTERDWNSFPCHHCERHFTSKQGLERHMHIHTLANSEAHTFKGNKGDLSFSSNVDKVQHETMKPVDSEGLAMLFATSSTITAQPDRQELSDGQHACKYCEKIFTTHTNKRRHERRIHEQHLVEKTQEPPQEENPERLLSETSQPKTEDPAVWTHACVTVILKGDDC